MRGIDDRIDLLERRHRLHPLRAVEQFKLVAEDAPADAGTLRVVKQVQEFAAEPGQAADVARLVVERTSCLLYTSRCV